MDALRPLCQNGCGGLLEIQSSPEHSLSPRDEFDLDSYNLRPMTEGLGFHHGEKKQVFTRPHPRHFASPRPAKKRASQQEVRPVKEHRQLMAFFVDAVLLLVIYCLLLGIFMAISGPLPSPPSQIFKELLPHLMPLFGMIFVLYFTLFDPMGTFGKRLMNIRVVCLKDHSTPTLSRCCLRAIFSVGGLFLLAIPLVLDLHGRGSQTRLVEH